MKHSHGLTRKRRRLIIQSRKRERRYASRGTRYFLVGTHQRINIRRSIINGKKLGKQPSLTHPALKEIVGPFGKLRDLYLIRRSIINGKKLGKQSSLTHPALKEIVGPFGKLRDLYLIRRSIINGKKLGKQPSLTHPALKEIVVLHQLV